MENSIGIQCPFIVMVRSLFKLRRPLAPFSKQAAIPSKNFNLYWYQNMFSYDRLKLSSNDVPRSSDTNTTVNSSTQRHMVCPVVPITCKPSC